MPTKLFFVILERGQTFGVVGLAAQRRLLKAPGDGLQNKRASPIRQAKLAIAIVAWSPFSGFLCGGSGRKKFLDFAGPGPAELIIACEIEVNMLVKCLFSADVGRIVSAQNFRCVQ